MSFDVRPWPAYSEHGEGPFWDVRVESRRFVGWVTWAAHRGRFVESNELARLRKRNGRMAYALAAYMANFSPETGQPDRDRNNPERDTQAGQSDRDNRDSLARAGSLRLGLLLSRSGHNERDGTKDRDTSSNGCHLGRDRCASRPGRAWA